MEPQIHWIKEKILVSESYLGTQVKCFFYVYPVGTELIIVFT